jgi:hypothetical protein
LIPEVIKNIPYDKSVDLYLYGLLAYEMMTGQAAYPANENEEYLKKKILKSDFKNPRELSS